MIVMSVIIIILGIISAVALYSGVSSEIAKSSGEELIVQGTDIAAIAGKAGNAGAAVLSGIVVAASFVLVVLQWLSYAVILIVKKLIKGDTET